VGNITGNRHRVTLAPLRNGGGSHVLMSDSVGIEKQGINIA
jgi:hypothetical protein